VRCQHEHTWQWVDDSRWLCSECGTYSDCTCKPTDPGPYHMPNCPRRAYWDSLPGIGEKARYRLGEFTSFYGDSRPDAPR